MPSPEFENIVQLFTAQRAAAPATEPTPEEMRLGYDMLGGMLPPVDGVVRTDTEIAGISTARFDPPGGATDGVVLHFHGGGYAIGSAASHTPLAANLAKASGSSILVPEYRLAPEDPFPAALDDAHALWDAVASEASKVVLSGDSAGGGLALALLVSLRDAGRPLPPAAVIISPWCDLTSLGDVSAEALEIDFLQPDTIERFAKWYAPPDASDPCCSPLLADLGGLPPLLIQAGECEILCDQARRLAARAKDAGVDVTLEVEPGMFHEIAIFAGGFPEASEAVARVASFIRERLN